LSATTPENWQAASVLPEHAEFWKLDRVLTRSLRDACEIGAATVKSSSEPSHFLTHPLSRLHRQHAQSLVRSAATKKLKGPEALCSRPMPFQ
jgi:hypothetical protein